MAKKREESKMKKIIIISLFLIFLIGIVSVYAQINVGTEGEIGVDLNVPTLINYSLIPTVNSSDWWDGLNSPLASWTNRTNLSYVPYTDATGDVDIGANDFYASNGNFEFDLNLEGNGNQDLLISTDTATSYARLTMRETGEYLMNLIFHGSRYAGTQAGILKSNLTLFMSKVGDDDGGVMIGTEHKNPIYFIADNIVRMIINSSGYVGIGTSAPNSTLHIKANIPGIVGSHSAGQLIIQNPAQSVWSNAVITGYESDANGHPDQQLWYLGSASGSNSDILFLNRRSSNLNLGTSGITQVTIDHAGNVGINTTTPQNKLNVVGDLNVTGIIINDAIYCESSELVDQNFPTAVVRQRINISNVDEGNGITMSTGHNGTNITIDTSGVYHLVAQPQVKAGAVGGGKGDFHMWLEKHNTTLWVDIPDSNIELSLGTNEEDVVILATTLKLNQGEKLRLVASVSDNKILLHAQSPAGEPVIPSIIFTMYRVGS